MQMKFYKIDIYRKSKMLVFWFESKFGCHSIYSESLSDARRLFDNPAVKRRMKRIVKGETVSTIHFK